jgi:hypothetical protein
VGVVVMVSQRDVSRVGAPHEFGRGHIAFGGVVVRTPVPSAGMIRIRFDGFTESASQAKATPQVPSV